MEEVTKCRYIDCLDSREKEQILHELPVCDTSLCVRWLINSGHVDLIGKDLDALRSMKFFVCNNHFTEDCYLSKGTLKENAVPSPHWSNLSRTLKTVKTQRKVQANGQESSIESTDASHTSAKNCPSEFEANQWCRTCATKKNNLVSMTSKGKGTEMSLLSKLKLLIEIDDEDALPTKMCDECVDKLEQSFKFFQQIYVADNTLRHVFPNARTNNVSRKPLYSLGEHLKKEQREKEKEKEKEKEEELGDYNPKVTRGLFRRGRGRPRTRGYAGRARGRQRWSHRTSQIAMSVPQSISRLDNVVSSSMYDTGVEKSEALPKDEHRNEKLSVLGEQVERITVFSLLTDTCRSDEELDWADVLKVMNCQPSRRNSKSTTDEPIKIEIETVTETVKEAQTTAVKQETEQSTETFESDTVDKIQSTPEKKGSVAESKVDSVAVVEAKSEVEIPNYEETTHQRECKTIGVLHCEYCKETFKLKRELQTHLATNHSQLSGHTCTDCLAHYESESLLSKHRALRHGQRRYRCEHCKVEFLEKRVLREHVNKCQLSERSYYSCDSCGVVLSSKQDLVEHVSGHTKSSDTSFQLDPRNTKGGTTTNESVAPSKPFPSDPDREVSVATTSSNTTVLTSKSNSSDDTVASLNNAENASNTSVVVSAEERILDDREHAKCSNCNEITEDTMEASGDRTHCRSNKRKDATCLVCGKKSFSSPEDYEQHAVDHSKRPRMSPS
ncbi:uncharacterized protein LOC116425040 [Nomia melanderi]|uniref:uncharacterized protein LOC116425040 n=1 Tax=Nomia melanderi TaxID=2448451 RepID=UPI00130443D4|nr:zinc finger protein 197-like [Nomia melanderi]XP_031828083.1 zinc finger protein 197-like [Nomia melanderi]